MAPQTASRAGPACRRLSGRAVSRETGSGSGSVSFFGPTGFVVCGLENRRISPAAASAPSQWAVSISQPPAGFGRRPPSEPTKNKGLMTPVAAAMGSSSRPASPPRSQSPSSRWADAGDPDSQQKHTVIHRCSCPPRWPHRPFKHHHGKQRGHHAAHKHPRRTVDRVQHRTRVQQHQRRQPKKPRHETSSFAKRTAASSLPAAFFLKLPDLAPFFSAEDRLFSGRKTAYAP